MDSNKEIIVAMTGTITIPTDAYEELVRKSVALDLIVAHSKTAPYSSDVQDFVKAVKTALYPVITEREDEEDGEDDA